MITRTKIHKPLGPEDETPALRRPTYRKGLSVSRNPLTACPTSGEYTRPAYRLFLSISSESSSNLTRCNTTCIKASRLALCELWW